MFSSECKHPTSTCICFCSNLWFMGKWVLILKVLIFLQLPQRPLTPKQIMNSGQKLHRWHLSVLHVLQIALFTEYATPSSLIKCNHLSCQLWKIYILCVSYLAETTTTKKPQVLRVNRCTSAGECSCHLNTVTVSKPGHPVDPWSLSEPVQYRHHTHTHTHLLPIVAIPSFPLSSPPPLFHPPSFHTLPHPPSPILTVQLSHCPAISQHSEGRAHRGLLWGQRDGRRRHTVRATEKADVRRWNGLDILTWICSDVVLKVTGCC